MPQHGQGCPASSSFSTWRGSGLWDVEWGGNRSPRTLATNQATCSTLPNLSALPWRLLTGSWEVCPHFYRSENWGWTHLPSQSVAGLFETQLSGFQSPVPSSCPAWELIGTGSETPGLPEVGIGRHMLVCSKIHLAFV